MEIGIIVAQAMRHRLKHPPHASQRKRLAEGGQCLELGLKLLGGASQQLGNGILGHVKLSLYHKKGTT